MLALQVLLMSWILLFSCILVTVLGTLVIIWAIAELRDRLHRLKLRKSHRQYEYELLENLHIVLWRRKPKRFMHLHQSNRQGNKGVNHEH